MEIYDLDLETSVSYLNAFEGGNDMSLLFTDDFENITVLGGGLRGTEITFSNFESNEGGELGFYRGISEDFPNQYFGYGAELLGVEIGIWSINKLFFWYTKTVLRMNLSWAYVIGLKIKIDAYVIGLKIKIENILKKMKKLFHATL